MSENEKEMNEFLDYVVEASNRHFYEYREGQFKHNQSFLIDLVNQIREENYDKAFGLAVLAKTDAHSFYTFAHNLQQLAYNMMKIKEEKTPEDFSDVKDEYEEILSLVTNALSSDSSAEIEDHVEEVNKVFGQNDPFGGAMN